MSENFSHKPVLYEETVESLQVVPDGTYVDCTAGGGGHSAGILERLGGNGRLVCIDRDPDATAALTARFGADARVMIVHDNYFLLKTCVFNQIRFNGKASLLIKFSVVGVAEEVSLITSVFGSTRESLDLRGHLLPLFLRVDIEAFVGCFAHNKTALQALSVLGRYEYSIFVVYVMSVNAKEIHILCSPFLPHF